MRRCSSHSTRPLSAASSGISPASAQIISDEQGYLTSRLGTVNYMAPEIMARQVKQQQLAHLAKQSCNNIQAYNQSADIWSCGIILYVLLCGFPPYEGTQGANGRPDYPKTLAKIQQRCDADGRFDYFPDPYWSSISKSAQDLIRSMVLAPPPPPHVSSSPIS
jgi:serine/threonine-protein kinase CHEK2